MHVGRWVVTRSENWGSGGFQTGNSGTYFLALDPQHLVGGKLYSGGDEQEVSALRP